MEEGSVCINMVERQLEFATDFLKKTDLRQSQARDQHVSELDPLAADAVLAIQLPAVNDSKDVNSLVAVANGITPSPQGLDALNAIDAMAATRDLGMIVASLQRHQVPLEVVPDLEPALLRLSATTGEVPRDTVTSYGTRNPLGERMRRFTNLPEEKLFIESFRNAMDQLVPCISALGDARDLSLDDPTYSELVAQAATEFGGMVNSIVAVRRHITPETFTFGLRPYFDPITIGGKEYMAPGGAQMPVLIVDLLLHASDSKLFEQYRPYLEDNLQYLPTEYRTLAQELIGRESLVTSAVNEVKGSHVHTDAQAQSLSALEGFVLTMNKFRVPHLKVAQANMAIRTETAKGSGGYRPDVLELLVEMTQNARVQIADAKVQVEGNKI